MKEIIRELDIALDRIQSLKLQGTYNNVKNQTDAIEALLRAGEMLKVINIRPEQEMPTPVPDEQEPAPEIEVEVEEIGNA